MADKIQICKARTVLDERPGFEQVQEAAANCRFDLNKEKPLFKLAHILSVIEHKEDKFIIHTEIGFTE